MTGEMSRGTPRDNIGSTPVGIIGSISRGPFEVNVETLRKETTSSAREQIEGHPSALKSLLKENNGRGIVSPIHLSFDDVEDRKRVRTVVTGKEIGDADMKRPFKKAVKTPLTRRIIEFAGPEFKMPQTLDGSARGWFENLSQGSIDGWAEIRQQFTTRFSTMRVCFKYPTKITKIVRKANETLVTFKERWIVETGFITGVPEVMKISSFMDAHKCPKLVKRYSDKVPKTMDEMMMRLDEFVRSEEAFASTELPKGEVSEASRKSAGPVSRREDRFHRGGYGADRRRTKEETRLTIGTGWYRIEILASEPQLNLQPPRPMQLPPKKENQDKYCDYHKEKGHYTNDCFQLRRQLEMALESGKLNHLIKDVRQRGRRNAKGKDARKDKVINMIRSLPNDRKRKSVERDESWMKAPIVFPPLSMEDASDEPLIIEAVMEGYLVHMVYVDQGASMEVMFEHCFENLSLAIRSHLRDTQIDFLGFAGGVVKPLGKIKLEVVFGDGGLFRTVMINFTATLVNPAYPDQLITIGGNLSEQCKNQLRILLNKSMDVFAWEPANMTGIPRSVIKHSLNVNPLVEPVAQKRRVMASDRTRVVSKEGEEWVSAGIVRPVRYSIWISNPVLVKKSDGSWRMFIDFKNINSACPKDYYPLPDIDGKIDSVVGFRYKCFLDAYKGYHQVQMLQDDEEKTAFYTDQSTYCYTKMPFGLKNVGDTYQRLVDTAFQSQIERNREAFVDDMFIKSNDEKVLIEDIAETFDNLQRINMKLNPKKCSFGVEEGKFMGDAEPEWKLDALKRFLSRAAEKSLPFFETLKDITKENKDEYRWTGSAKKAFQEMKKVIVELPLLTNPVKEETLYVYVATETEAANGCLFLLGNDGGG
nr:hypothetical protein [Tanacetum cinerariifolium]